MATRPAANARAPSRVARDAIRLIGLINLSKLAGLRLHGLPERRIRSFPAPLDQPRNDTVCGIDVDDGVHETAARVTRGRPVHHLRDRKSTRLNSSHSSISYAVFCLKK